MENTESQLKSPNRIDFFKVRDNFWMLRLTSDNQHCHTSTALGLDKAGVLQFIKHLNAEINKKELIYAGIKKTRKK